MGVRPPHRLARTNGVWLAGLDDLERLGEPPFGKAEAFCQPASPVAQQRFEIVHVRGLRLVRTQGSELVAKVSVMSIAWSGCGPAITQTSSTVHASKPSSASSAV